MSVTTNGRAIARPHAPSFSFTRIVARVAGSVVAGVEAVMNRAELRRSRRQLAELDDRLLRDIGLDRGKARYEAGKGFWQ